MDKSKIKLETTKVFLAKEDSRIETVAKKVGIVLPSNHTAVFQAIFASLEKANGNKIRLASKTVKETLPLLIGSQVNLNHLGKGFLLGTIFDAWIEDTSEDIHIIFSFAKNIYSDEYIQALEAMAENKLSVSFELSSDMKLAEELEDGTVRLNDISWEGVGLLIGKNPAYKNAKVYQVAETFRQRALDSEKELIFASQIIESCDRILAEEDKQQEKQGGKANMTEEQKALVAQIRAELGDFIPKDTMDETLLDELSVAKFRVIKRDAEEKAEKDKTLAEAKKLSQENVVISTIYKDDGSTEVSQEKYCVYTWLDSDGKVRQDETKIASNEIYKYTEVDMKDMVKSSDVEIKIAELQAIIDTQRVELEKFQAEEIKKIEAEKLSQLNAIKSGLKDNKYVAEFKDEDYLNEVKVEKAKLLQERDNLRAENELLKKTPIVAEIKKEDIETGHKEKSTTLNARELIAKIGKK